MAAMTIYTAVCEREDNWWIITVPELDGRVTQAKRLDQVERMVRSLVAIVLDVPKDSFEIVIKTVMPDAILTELREVDALRREAEAVSERASKATRKAAKDLARMGLTVRDIGTALRVSPQRVSQLLKTS
jgi:predicted RNase H-like HicB family nuclease